MAISFNDIYMTKGNPANDTTFELPYFTLWLLMLSVPGFLDPNTRLLNNPNDKPPLTLAQLQAKPGIDAGTVNYLDLKIVAAALAQNGVQTLSPLQIGKLLALCMGKTTAVYGPAMIDFNSAGNSVGFYPILHGCGSTQGALDVLTGTASPAGTSPKVP
jgi:hypothetical protein